ncbi:MAG: type II toxin-antitoxin system Phd/YefM family antitoxin [Vicingaceae bacterium]
MKVSPTELRKDLYQLLDQVLESNEPLYIKRKGRELVISEKKNKDIYQIMDERSLVNEPDLEKDVVIEKGLDEDWEKQWEQKWDEWLKES